jgi:serine/threonine-protein kinase HipA
MTDQLRVTLYGNNLGFVGRDPETGIVSFEYAPEFRRASAFEPAPIMMKVSPRIFSFPALTNSSFQGLPGMIADALPDHYGTEVIRKYFLAQGRNPAAVGPLEMLAYIGNRAFGALEFHPHESLASTEDIDIGIFNLWDESRKILLPKDESDLPDGMELVYKFGSTAGGARAKAAILFNAETREFKVQGLGQGLPAKFDHWLLKFDGLAKDHDLSPKPYERMEYVYSLLARAAGVDVPRSDFYEEENGMFHFLVKRFDRVLPGEGPPGKRHLQTLSALGHFDHNAQQTLDYDTYLRICQGLTRDAQQVSQAYRRLVFNVLSHNFDDHAKNFSFLMESTGTWTLSPAYDNVFTSLSHPWFARGHQLTIGGKALDITRQDLLDIAEPFDIAETSAIIDEVRAGISQWAALAKEFGIEDRFPEYVKEVSTWLRKVDTD